MALFKKALEKLARGLSRTRQKLVSSLKSFLTGRALDAETMDDLEAVLIQADMGVATVARIRQDLEAAAKDKRISRGEDVVEFLKVEFKKYWPPDDRTRPLGRPPAHRHHGGGDQRMRQDHLGGQARLAVQDGGQEGLPGRGGHVPCGGGRAAHHLGRPHRLDIVKGAGNDPAAVVFDACDAAWPAGPTCCWWTRPGGCTRRTT